MSKVPIKPLGERIVAVYEEATTKTASGLYLPPNAKEKSQIAKVVAVGSEVKEVKADDRIIVREYATTDVKIDGVDYLIVKEEDVLGIVA
jgi:chaperonin GroES